MLLFPTVMLLVTLGVLTRKEPIPLLDELLGGGRRALPPPQPNGTGGMTSQPSVPAERMHAVTYLQGGVRFFQERVCFSLFEQLKGYTLEPFKMEGRESLPGIFRLVPWTQGNVVAADAVMTASERGIYTLVSVASSLSEYASVDKVLVFAADLSAAHAGTQFAVLGPIKVQRPQVPAQAQAAAPRAATPAPSVSYEQELEHAASAGLPKALIVDTLANDAAPPAMLDEIALTLPQYPAIADKLRARANVLRAVARMEEMATSPATVLGPQGTMNGAAEPSHTTVIEAEGRAIP